MMILLYILKSTACLSIFIGFYKLFFESESFHFIKRFYLFFALAFAFTIPFIKFTQYIEVISAIMPQNNQPLILKNAVLPSHKTNYWPIIIWCIYGVGMSIFLVKFIVNLFKIFSTIKKNTKYKKHNFINVLVNELQIPYTFFNYIFLNKQEFEQHKIPQEVLLHEQTHAKEKHSIDILLIELLQIFFWFNPLIYIFKKAIKLNHEFLADRSVIKEGIQPNKYQQLILSFSSNATNHQLVNAINYSSIKKRFTVMKKQTSQKTVWLKSIMILPLFAISIYIFSEKVVAQENKIDSKDINHQEVQENKITLLLKRKNKILFEEEKKVFNLSELKTFIDKKLASSNVDEKENITVFIRTDSETEMGFITDVKSIFLNRGIYNIKNKPVSLLDVMSNDRYSKQNATPEMVAEYNRLAKKYMPGKSKKIYFNSVEVERMTYIYNHMNESQQEKAEPFPIVTPPVSPSPPQAPTEIVKPISPVRPLPPSPPLDHVKEMAKIGAKFYYNGNAISSDEAITIMKNNEALNLVTSHSGNKDFVVRISTEPIELED